MVALVCGSGVDNAGATSTAGLVSLGAPHGASLVAAATVAKVSARLAAIQGGTSDAAGVDVVATSVALAIVIVGVGVGGSLDRGVNWLSEWSFDGVTG